MIRYLFFWIICIALIVWSGFWAYGVVAVTWLSADIANAFIKEVPLVRDAITAQNLSENIREWAVIYGLFMWSMPAAALASCALLVRPSRSKEQARIEKKMDAAAPAERKEPTI